MTPEYKDFLAHYGVKGQKWGKRQWQNEDGTYTEEGKERYWGGDGQQQRLIQQPVAQRQPSPKPKQMTTTEKQAKMVSDQVKRHAIKAAASLAIGAASGVALKAVRASGKKYANAVGLLLRGVRLGAAISTGYHAQAGAVKFASYSIAKGVKAANNSRKKKK